MKSATKEKRVTIADIARESSVSSSAVSSFLNNREYGIRLGKEAQLRILEACRRLDYRPKNDYAMRRLYPKLGDICFLINSVVPGGLHHQYYGKMLSGVVSSQDNSAQSVTYALFDREIDYEKEPDKLPPPMRNGSSTRFIAASAPNPTLVRQALKNGFPFVYLGHVLDIPGLCCILPDYAEATRMAIRYLAKLGHKRIAYITGPLGEGLYNILEMDRGFSEGIRETGLKLSQEHIYHCESHLGEYSREDLAAAADYLMALNPRPTAIFCLHDPAATVVSAHLQSRGYRIPDDVSIMGCNDEPAAATHHPGLTTIHFPLEEMGVQATKEIEKQISLGIPEGRQIIKLPVKVVERMSCGAPTNRNHENEPN